MKTNGKSQKQIVLTPPEFCRLRLLGYVAKPASLHQAMGPNWRHIFFVSQDGTKKNRARVHYYDVDMKPDQLYAIAQGRAS